MYPRCAAPARFADILNVFEAMRHAAQGFARGETWMAMSTDRVGVATTPSAQPAPPKQVTAPAPAHSGPDEIDLTTELPNVMLAADMVSANIAVLQRAASAYQEIIAMGTEAAQYQSLPDAIGAADPAAGVA
jgi:hypothetical protein